MPTLKRPENVRIVWLRKRDQDLLETGGNYQDSLLSRVELYFRRFFSTESKMKLTMKEVGVIINEDLTRNFREAATTLNAICNGSEEFLDSKQNPTQLAYLQELNSSENLVKGSKANGIAAWHGCKSSKLESICSYGLFDLNTLNEGWYGKGIYLTQLPNYGQYYVENKAKNEGEFTLLLCWALLGKPYAVIEMCKGAPCHPGYTSHFVLVNENFKPLQSGQKARGVCRKEKYRSFEILSFSLFFIVG